MIFRLNATRPSPSPEAPPAVELLVSPACKKVPARLARLRCPLGLDRLHARIVHGLVVLSNARWPGRNWSCIVSASGTHWPDVDSLALTDAAVASGSSAPSLSITANCRPNPPPSLVVVDWWMGPCDLFASTCALSRPSKPRPRATG